MITFLRGLLAIVLGLVVGSAVNMGLILLSPHVIPPPPGVDVNDAKSISASMHLFEPKHFLFPFLAHALGTLCGAAIAYLVAARYRLGMSLVIGVLFLAGGIAASFMIPAPAWFIATDLVLAYLPMAWLGARLGRAFSKEATPA
ncbi:MAG: hypothetical protein V4773_06395 [Verrucomicrobiota bacterium]